MQFTVTGSNVQAVYKEPTENEPDDAGNVTPLTDLSKTSIKFQISGEAETVAKEVPASAPTGGGDVNETITIPALGDRKLVSVDLWATATDLVGNESVPSEKTTLTLDRLAPKAPN